MDGWICKLMSVLLIKLKKDEEEKRSNLIGEEGLPSILKQATTKSNHDDIWHQIPSYTINYIITNIQRTGSGSYEAWRDDRAVGRARGGLGCLMVPPPKNTPQV